MIAAVRQHHKTADQLRWPSTSNQIARRRAWQHTAAEQIARCQGDRQARAAAA